MVLKEIQLAFGFHSLVQTIYSTLPRVNNVQASQGVWTVSLLLYSNDIKIKQGPQVSKHRHLSARGMLLAILYNQ
jgi:hypothetical protein